MFELQKPTPLEKLAVPLFEERGVEVFVKRDDQIDQEISGNKWRKLKYNLMAAKAEGYQKVLTFGGAYSNHIAATAAACKRFGFQSVGIIRGDELHADSNPTLQKAADDGMQLLFISRSEYKHREDEAWVRQLAARHEAFDIPEGGSNELALKGVSELMTEIDIAFDYIICPVGTGGTLAGLVKGLRSNQQAIGISSLKGEAYLENSVLELTEHTNSWELIHDYHFGGYAKYDQELIAFINQFFEESQMSLDPVYTGKMMYAVFDLIKKGKFPQGSRLVCVHTGGLQGIAGFNQQHNDLLKT